MLKTNTVDTIALLSICISFWNALYSINILYVSLSVRQKCVKYENTIFSAPNQKKRLIFLCTYLSYMSIFCINILCVCLSFSSSYKRQKYENDRNVIREEEKSFL